MRVGLKRNANLHCYKNARFREFNIEDILNISLFLSSFSRKLSSVWDMFTSKQNASNRVSRKKCDIETARGYKPPHPPYGTVSTSIAQTFHRFTLGYNDFDFCLQNGAFQTGDTLDVKWDS